MVRFKNRYLLFRLVWKDGKIDESLNEAAILQVFRESVQQNFGDHGLGTLLQSLQVKYYCPVTGLCLVRAAREQHQQVWAAATTITDIKMRAVAVHFMRLGGTLATCQQAALAAGPQLLSMLRVTSQQQQLAAAAEDKLRHLDL